MYLQEYEFDIELENDSMAFSQIKWSIYGILEWIDVINDGMKSIQIMMFEILSNCKKKQNQLIVNEFFKL